MIRQRQKQMRILLWILSLIAVATVVAAFIDSIRLVRPSKTTANAFDDAWVLEDAKSGDTIFRAPGHIATPAGQPVILKNRLPKTVEENTVLMIETQFQHFSVKVGDAVVYECSRSADHTIGAEPFPDYYMMPISNDYAGSEITLEIVSGYASYSGEIGALLYGVKGEVLLQFLKTHIAGFLGGLLLVATALILFCMKVGLAGYDGRQYELSCLSMMALLFGLFMVLGNKLVFLLFEGTQGLWMGRLLSVMLLPFFYGMYLYCIIDKKQIRRFLDCAMILLFLNFLAAYVIILLGLLDVVVYSQIAVGTVLAVLVFLTFILFAGGAAFEKRDLTYHGISNIVFFIFIVLYALAKRRENLAPYREWFLAAGVLIWCLLMLLHTVGRLSDTLRGERLLQKKAVQDYRQQTLLNLKPDAIFGGLHTLLDMMKRQDTAAPHYLVHISNYLRGRMNMLRYERDMMIPFQEEFLHIQGGLEMMMHKNRNFSYNTEIKVEDFSVPAFAVEAFVENAMLHGAGTEKQPTVISVKTYETQKDYAVQIIDTGKGFDVDRIKEQGEYGILQTIKRLEQQADATVDIRSREGKGTVVTIKLPKSQAS